MRTRARGFELGRGWRLGEADADDQVLAYQYIQQLKEIANGQATKIWMIPAELSGAAAKIAEAFKSKG